MAETKRRHQMIAFRADEEVLRALDSLEAAVDSTVVAKRKRSVAIRRAILDAEEKLGKRRK